MLALLEYSPIISASDYGTTGLIDVPTARMQADGKLSVLASFDGLHQSYSATYQAAPWLEATFRYTGFEDFFYWDRNYGFKVRLVEEDHVLPQIAVGVRDAVGTGVFGSEYLVSSKKLGGLDVTLGMAWGRLAGNGDFRNPLVSVDTRFGVRPDPRGLADTGVFRPIFFRGKNMGMFGGLSYEFPDHPVKVVAEYNPDEYEWNNLDNRPRYEPTSKVSFGIEWSPSAQLTLGLNHQHGDHFGVFIKSSLDTKALPKERGTRRFVSSLYLGQDSLPKQINKNKWYDRLLYDLERSGLLLLEGGLSADGTNAKLVVGNASFPLWSDAINLHIALADLHLPPSVEIIHLVVEDGGHRSATVVTPRPSHYSNGEAHVMRSRILNGQTLRNPEYRTRFSSGKVINTLGIDTRFQLFDPDDPARYQVFLAVSSEYTINNHWALRSGLSLNLDSNFNQSRRLESDSQLPNVRSGVVKYLTEGKSGIDSLFLEGRDSVGSNLHFRAYAGILEEMYSGFGGELLWWRPTSRFAVGASMAVVRQRDFDKSLKHLDYQVVTGFVSAYWATPYLNYDVAVHAGRYLAKDLGVTFDLRRTFRNGWQIGVFATLTDVPFDTFGEGSFDKGFYFQVPIEGLFGGQTRSKAATRIRPVLRDGGQRLEGHSGNIFWDLREARYDALLLGK